MTVFTKPAITIFAATDAFGAPRSVVNEEVQTWGTEVERIIKSALATGGGSIYGSKADMVADTSQAANAMAWVLGDATAANNGVYQFDGTSTWTRLGDLPYSYINASNAGAGTANAIVVTTSIPVPAADGAALIALPIVADNDQSPVTVKFNDGPDLPIKTNSGNDVEAGYLVAGSILAGYVSGSTFQLISDVATAADKAAAEAAATAAETAQAKAEDAQAAAQAAAAGLEGASVYMTLALAEAITPVSAPDFIRTAGYSAAGDGGAALYKKVASEPSHDGKFSITLSDGATVVWYELAELRPSPEMFGAPKDGTNDDAAAINSAITYANAVSAPEVLFAGTYTLVSGSIVPKNGVMLRGTARASTIVSKVSVAYQLSAANAPLQHAGIDGLKFKHYDNTDTSAIGMKLDACSFCKWSNLYFEGYNSGTVVNINPTISYADLPSGGVGIDIAADSINFVFNKFDQIFIPECSVGFSIAGGGDPAIWSNVVTANEYHGVVMRAIHTIGVSSAWNNDNDRFYDFHLNIVKDGAVCVSLGGGSETDYIGVSGHHFYGLTMVRDMTVTWTTGAYGVVLRNTPQCLFVLASDGHWPTEGGFLNNKLDVEVDVRASYMHNGVRTDDALTNRIATISQQTFTRQTGNESVASGVTSHAVAFSEEMFDAPTFITITPRTGLPTWAIASITSTGFTLNFASATTAAGGFYWKAEVNKARSSVD